jgi:hypothetical protein
MKKSSIIITLLLSVLIFMPNQTKAQFEVNKHYLGPSIGFAFGASTVSFGANYEYGILWEEVGNIGVGGIFRYWSYSEGYWSYTDIVIGAQANYHFKLKNRKFDPWAGLVLAFDIGSSDWSGPYDDYWTDDSYGGMWFAINAGARYWISPTIGLNGRLSFGSLGYGGIEFGVDFKL